MEKGGGLYGNTQEERGKVAQCQCSLPNCWHEITHLYRLSYMISIGWCTISKKEGVFFIFIFLVWFEFCFV